MQKKIKSTLINIFKKHGLSENHAKICSEALINAELVGAPSHGLSRLMMYCKRIQKKLINPKPRIKVKKISQSISFINADNSIGFVAADIGSKQLKMQKKLELDWLELKKAAITDSLVITLNKLLKKIY